MEASSGSSMKFGWDGTVSTLRTLVCVSSPHILICLIGGYQLPGSCNTGHLPRPSTRAAATLALAWRDPFPEGPQQDGRLSSSKVSLDTGADVGNATSRPSSWWEASLWAHNPHAPRESPPTPPSVPEALTGFLPTELCAPLCPAQPAPHTRVGAQCFSRPWEPPSPA